MLCGVGLGLVLVEPAVVAMVRGVGVMRMESNRDPWTVLALGLGIIALAAAMMARTGRIRRITAYELFQDA